MEAPKHIERYSPHYDGNKFWKKVQKQAKKLGVKAVYYALILYYALQSPDISRKDRNTIYGALGYLILPLDLLPDFIPVVGYSDDIAALTLAIYKVIRNITPSVKAQAEGKVYEWFGNDVDQADLTF